MTEEESSIRIAEHRNRLWKPWLQVGDSFRVQFDGGTVIYYISWLQNRLGNARIVLDRATTDIRLWLENDPIPPLTWDDTPPEQCELTDVPIIARARDTKRIVGMLTLQAESFGIRSAGFPTINDLIWMDYLLNNYERIIDDILPSE